MFDEKWVCDGCETNNAAGTDTCRRCQRRAGSTTLRDVHLIPDTDTRPRIPTPRPKRTSRLRYSGSVVTPSSPGRGAHDTGRPTPPGPVAPKAPSRYHEPVLPRTSSSPPAPWPVPPDVGPGRPGHPPATPLPIRASTSWLKDLGKIVVFVLACLVVLFLIGVFGQAMNILSRERPNVAPGNTSLADPAAAYTELNQQVLTDSPDVDNLAESWVPELASARQGLVVNGVTLYYTDILTEYRTLRQQYPQARLTQSLDWTVFSDPDSFVTVLAVPYQKAEDANTWCDQQGIDRNHCFAQLLSRVRGPEGTTQHR